MAVFKELANAGFNLGADKKLNGIMADGWERFLQAKGKTDVSVRAEKALAFCPNIIPDNTIEYTDAAFCIEYTWRNGDFLANANRSSVAQYILMKLRNYVRELGWTAD